MEHLVSSHLGGYYVSNNDVDDIEKVCEQCGDSDYVITSWEKGNKLKSLLSYFSLLKETKKDI